MKQLTLLFFINLLIIPFFSKVIYSATYTIYMHDGGTVEASHYLIEGDTIKVLLQSPKDAIIDFPRAYVDKIVKNEEEETNKANEKKEINPTGLCETNNINCDEYYWCHELAVLRDKMETVCDKAEIPRNYRDNLNREDNFKNCRRYKIDVHHMEENYQNCNVVNICCKIESPPIASHPKAAKKEIRNKY